MNAWTSVRVESLDKYFLMRLMLYRWNDKVLHILNQFKFDGGV